uniref:Latent-transforming growth factor beta-binding protein 4 n=1 Tax=Oncorhynchus tshawytscha TaxID=74940 RepID=A0A8C8CBR5_ONCTS
YIPGGAERIKVLFTPTVCKVRCTQGRCTNFCEQGNVTALYISEQGDRAALGPGFRVFLCPMLCQNGGVCIQKDRCLCPPTFTGKFCHIPVATPSTNDIEKPPRSPSVLASQQLLSQSEYILPLQSQQQSHTSGSSMVKVRVQHPPEASVKIHQVLKVGYGPGTVREQSETVTWSAGLSGASTSVLPGERAAATPPKPRVQAQTLHGNFTNPESSVFKYCFREVRNGQCSSPLPGLRSQDTCCRGIGLAWGINECVLCPPNTGKSPPPTLVVTCLTFLSITKWCLQPGFCENGNCVNTRGSYSCVCRQGYILDASHGICISHRVISEDKDQCYRILNSGSGRGSCSVPILRNITKQICCCSRVGKAWGENCERCPYFGSVAFKEICPAGPGYHYSASVIQFNQRLLEQHGTGGPPVISQSTGQTRPQQPARGGAQTPQNSHQQSSGSLTPQTRPQQPGITTLLTTPTRPQQPGGARPLTQTQWLPVDRRPVSPVRPAQPLPPLVTPRPPIPRPVRGVCETMPQVCGQGRCVNQPGGRHTCICNEGYQLNAQQNQCQDIDECRASLPPCGSGRCQNTDGGYRCSCPSGYQPGPRGTSCIDIDDCRQVTNPCNNGRCENSPGSFKCVCRTGYTLEGNACKDVDECEDPLRCPVQACANSPGSYKCVSCPPGFGLLNEQCSDVDECHQTPSLCTNGHCENTPGSYRCVCHTGYKLQGKTCTDVDECEDPLRCPGQACVNSQGSYNCVSCKPGFRMINGHCSDIDECRQTPSPCTTGHCENTQGSYSCACLTGYRLHGDTCTDVDECADPSQCPGQECVNSLGSYKCVSCKPGFELVNRHCTDIDECRQTSNLCANGRCENTPGSYRCVCRTGFKPQGSICIDLDECEDASQCPGQRCVNSEGSYKCIACKAGHGMRDGLCTGKTSCLLGSMSSQIEAFCPCSRRGFFSLYVDECQSPDTCGAARLCVNTDGSYRCDCQPGYRTAGLGRQCRDVNECLEGEYCFPRGECVNTEGSYRCVCSQGYTTSSDGGSCLDVDECARSGPGACQDGRCVNTEGSYQCQCQVGFTTNPEKTACLDVDECSEGAVCRSQRCENTVGSYRCITSCEPGYRVTRTGECVDINECANETVCGEHAFCQNLIGTYQCMCDQGYTATSDGKGCVDENECETMQGVCGTARCENVDGSFMCECPGEGEEFDTRSGQCLSTPRPGTLPPARPGEFRECYYSTGEQSSCSVLAHNTTQQECCCTVGQGWGMGCQYNPCPPLGTAEHQALCPSGRGYVTGPGAFSYKDVDECKLFHPEVCKSGVCVNNIPGYSCYCTIGYYYDEVFLECIDVDECEAGEDSCPGGICVNILGSHFCTCEPPLVLDDTQRSCVNSTDLAVDENLSFCWQFVTADLVCQSPLLGGQVTFTECCCLYGEGWGLHCALCPARDSGTTGLTIHSLMRYYGHAECGSVLVKHVGFLPPSPERYYDEDDYGPPDAPPRPHFRTLPDPRSELEGPEPWRVGPPFPPFPDRQGPGGGGGPRRVYERRYEPYAGLSTEDCGILHGCENGRCIRVAEGYTCDCYEGYELDMTSMACIDINECVDPDNACANGRCIDTDGSYRCVCHQGYVMSRRPNHCVAA